MNYKKKEKRLSKKEKLTATNSGQKVRNIVIVKDIVVSRGISYQTEKGYRIFKMEQVKMMYISEKNQKKKIAVEFFNLERENFPHFFHGSFKLMLNLAWNQKVFLIKNYGE